MKCILYIPPCGCEGSKVSNISQLRVGGITLYERACRSIQAAKFDSIVAVRQAGLGRPPVDPIVRIPVTDVAYGDMVSEVSGRITGEVSEDGGYACICILDGTLDAKCLKMRPHGSDVRIEADGRPTGVYFVSSSMLGKILSSDHGLDDIEGSVSDTFAAEPGSIYRRILCADDARPAMDAIMRSLRKPMGRDADGLVAYLINRPCSLTISRRLANTPITPNMVSAFGLAVGLAGAGCVATGDPALMSVGAVMWQLSSMIDGIDGELARMRMCPSHSGEWFDTVADDVTNISFLFALGYGLSRLIGNDIPFYGVSALCPLLVILVLWFYREFVKMGIASHNHFEWGFESDERENRSNDRRGPIRRAADAFAEGVAIICKRDSYTFLIMCLILLSLHKTAFAVMFCGASVVCVAGFVSLIIRAIRMRKKG